jgi:hypothetical protein
MLAYRYLAAGLALATLTAAFGIATKARAEIIITNDRGGDVAAYSRRVEAARRSGERIIIDGACYSACTWWLTLPASQVCVTSRTVFGFHTASTKLGLPHPQTNDELLKALPPKARYAILSRGGLWLNTITIRGVEIARRCK